MSKVMDIKRKKQPTSIYFGGMPTDLDVKKIRENISGKLLAEGREIPYSLIEDILSIGRKETRFRTVTARWRNILEKEENIIVGITAETRGRAFVVFTDSQKVTYTSSKVRTAGRAMRRTVIVSAMVNRSKLEEEERKIMDHNEKIAGVLLAYKRLGGKKELPELL